MDMMLRMDKKLRSKIRAMAGEAGRSYPIEVVEGDCPPILVGRSYYWTTKTGIPVRHPTAYRACYGKPIYHHSTLAIQVGIECLREMGLIRS